LLSFVVLSIKSDADVPIFDRKIKLSIRICILSLYKNPYALFKITFSQGIDIKNPTKWWDFLYLASHHQLEAIFTH